MEFLCCRVNFLLYVPTKTRLEAKSTRLDCLKAFGVTLVLMFDGRRAFIRAYSSFSTAMYEYSRIFFYILVAFPATVYNTLTHRLGWLLSPPRIIYVIYIYIYILRYLRLVDKFNEQNVSAFLTAGGAKLMLLHDGRADDAIRSFFAEVHELYVKARRWWKFRIEVVSFILRVRFRSPAEAFRSL